MAPTLAHELNQPLSAAANSVNAARRLLASGEPHRIEMVPEVMDEAAAEIPRAGQIIGRLRAFGSRVRLSGGSKMSHRWWNKPAP